MPIENKNKTNITLSMPVAYKAGTVADALVHRGFAHVTGLLEEALFHQLRAELIALDAQDQLDRAGIGRGDDFTVKTAVRGDYTKWIDGDTLAECLLLERLEQVRLEMNEQLMLGLFEVEAHYAAYPPGSFYARHTDSFRGAKNRILSLVMYLNPDWRAEEGGLLTLFADEAAQRPFTAVRPELGHAVLFLSEEMPHEVTKAQRSRYSIAAWYHCHQPL
ncbi:2OG-Fe(II) oxygenase [Aestuariispira insulae]|uniref:SM-20-related protein n=1 Tax=Aestuariispira insulae TaxID=1461337 RepID=A0A3D9HRV2_9PROT|nr:2OG-Fe(II) oxygenase [Aestuariispira insulae]RED52243.1 SM-20-related protein [Aestuariispira insulae]